MREDLTTIATPNDPMDAYVYAPDIYHRSRR